MSSTDAVRYTVDDGIATITLNRPDTLNAFNNSLLDGISRAVGQVHDDASVRVLILTGAGRGFSADADLAAAADRSAAPPSDDAPKVSPKDRLNNVIRDLDTCPVPTIACINGAAAGGGFGLALACDITIAAHSAFFVATFGPKLGIVPDMGVTWNVPMRTGRARALGITLLGERIPATQAENWGLIWKAVPDEELDDETTRTAEVLKRSSPATSTRIRKTIKDAPYNTLSEHLDVEMGHQAVLIPRNMQEGATAFLEKREPRFGNERD